MTDRERLLEQVREAERLAAEAGLQSIGWMKGFKTHSPEELGLHAGGFAEQAAHHALTAMALRDVMSVLDDVKYRPWLKQG